jgi:SAM-dependent methyltransferase
VGTPDGTDAPDSRLESWPGENRRHPPASSATWLVRSSLTAWLRAEAATAAEAAEAGGLRVLDVGCGVKPYYPLFAGYADSYVGVDVVENRMAELLGSVEALPVEDGSFDVVLCTQVLEHCDDPVQAVKELRRVTAPGGRVLASTHGVQVFHPSPHDYWRWTHEGLRRLFTENASWGELGVSPAGGTAACLGMLLGTFVEIGCRRAHVARLARGPVWMLNRGGSALDRRVSVLRQPVPGALFANLHVTAVAPR